VACREEVEWMLWREEEVVTSSIGTVVRKVIQRDCMLHLSWDRSHDRDRMEKSIPVWEEES
jgi:hypothetical protein